MAVSEGAAGSPPFYGEQRDETSYRIQGQDYGLTYCSLFNFQGPCPVGKIWGYSSAGRAPALQAGGQRFDPAYLHQSPEGDTILRLKKTSRNQYGLIAQPVRASA